MIVIHNLEERVQVSNVRGDALVRAMDQEVTKPLGGVCENTNKGAVVIAEVEIVSFHMRVEFLQRFQLKVKKVILEQDQFS